MKKNNKKTRNDKAITLIALVITIVILIILAGVTINVTLGQKGIINQVKQATIDYKKAQYFEDINLEIIDEQTERSIKQKNEPLIESIENRLKLKNWVKNVTSYLGKTLIVDTNDGYQMIIDFDNTNNTATIRKDSFEKTDNKIYKITYNANNGTEETVESDSVRKGLGLKIQQSQFERQNYTFLRWCDNPDGSGNEYEVGDEYIVTGDVTLYAKWSQHAITIKYEANGGEGQMPDQNKEIGEEVTLSTRYSRIGYTFNGWKDQNNKTYEENQKITAEKDLTLTAQWSPIEYTITYNLDGGSLEEGVSNPSTYTAETGTFTLNNPQKDNFTFEGWTTSNDDIKQKTLTIEKGSTGNKTYIANWKVVKKYLFNNAKISGYEFRKGGIYTACKSSKSYINFSVAYGTNSINSVLTRSSSVNQNGSLDNVYTLCTTSIDLTNYSKISCRLGYSSDGAGWSFCLFDPNQPLATEGAWNYYYNGWRW